MKPAPVPANDPERLSKLAEYAVLDTPAEADFDALTELAASLLGVPIALVSLIDANRQWFKARYGLEVPETPRDVSFCGHVVAAEAPLVVDDAWKDERFADNPLVTGEPRVRFYAAMPLRTADGFVLGTLCAIDHEPRTLSPAQERILRALAAQVVSLLELRRQARELKEQRHALAVFTSFFELSPDLCCTADPSLHFRELNPAASRVLGWSHEELRARPFTELVHPDDLALTEAEAARLLRDEASTTTFENRYRHRDGHWVPLAWTARVAEGVFFASAHDQTERRAREEALAERDAALAESEAGLRALFDALGEGVVMQPRDGMIAAYNPAAARILGLSGDQLAGRSSLDPLWRAVREDGSVFPGSEHPAMETLRSGQPLTDVIMGVYKPSAELTWISINTRPLRKSDQALPHAVVTTFRDVTRERAQAAHAQRLARQERLVTTGTLAAGVGHEINNPLSYVLSNIEFSLEEVRAIAGGSPSGRLKDLVEVLLEARTGAERVRRIVRGLRALARDDGPPVPTDVNAATEVAVNMAMHELRQRATVVVDLPPLPPALADESRLTQVLVNLLMNAAQAFTSSNPEVNRVTVGGTSTAETVAISVADNGPGIPPDILARIFDPFFTTKPIGQGTGLGLSISQSIVTALGGDLRCDTVPDQGTTFTVRLPIAAPQNAPNEAAPNRPQGSGGRVLIIDDNEFVLKALDRFLRRDHQVTVESDPRMALQRLMSGERFDVIFCDLMMPHLTGKDVFEQATKFDQELASRFVFITGGVVRDDLDAFLAEIPNERLEKPIALQNLRSTVRRFLGQDSGTLPPPREV